MDTEDYLRANAQKLATLRDRPCYLFVSNSIHRVDCLKAHLHLSGAPSNGDGEDADETEGEESTPSELDVIVDAPGGDAAAAYKLVCRLRKQYDDVTMFVPRRAKSAATLMCLGADTLVLGDLGELGPLDAQIPERPEGDAPQWKSALNRIKALEQLRKYALESYDLATRLILNQSGMKVAQAADLAGDFAAIVAEPLFSKIDPLKVAESERSLAVGDEYGKRILTRYLDWGEGEARDLVRELVRGYPSHGFVIDATELDKIGLPVRPPSAQESQILDQLFSGLISFRKEAFGIYPPAQSSDSGDGISGAEEQEESEVASTSSPDSSDENVGEVGAASATDGDEAEASES